MKKILSILCVVVMLVSCISISAFAAASTINVTAVATKSGDKIALTFSSDVEASNLMIAVEYDSTLMTFDGFDSKVFGDSSFEYTASNNKSGTGIFAFGMKMADGGDVAMKEDFVTFYFTPSGAAISENPFSAFEGTATTVTSIGKKYKGLAITEFGQTTAYTIKNGKATLSFDADAIIDGGSTVVDEEEFETVTTAPTAGEYADFSSIALGTGATQLAVFGKNASAGLAAYDYGIVVGGVEFPGIADVDAGKYWCIKLVAPEGKDATGKAFIGNYKVKSYIITAEGTKYGDEVTVNVQ